MSPARTMMRMDSSRANRQKLSPPRQPTSENVHAKLQKDLAEQAAALQRAYTRLRVSDRMASIGALAAGLGHDMNNVLLPVRAHLNAARKLTMLPEVRKHLEAVQETVTYLQQLADGLHFLASDTDGEDREHGSTDLRAWWSHVGALLTKAVPKHVRVAASLPSDLPEVGVSAHALTQAILNLVVNAGQAIPRSRKGRAGRVTIRAHILKGGRDVQIAVTDNGVGMSPEVQRNAFEMFYTTKTRGMGTGLGLPLVARVIRRAGGTVQIDSARGKGTTVRLRVPVARSANEPAQESCVAITLTDGRAARIVQHLLGGNAVRSCLASEPPKSAKFWLLDPTEKNLRSAKAWRKTHPRGTLILFGKPHVKSARAWASLDAVIIKDRDDLSGIRAVLHRVIPGK